MDQYVKPEFHFVHLSGKLSGEELAKLSDEELADYLKRNHFAEEKKKYCIKSGYILREIAGEYAIVPVDAEGWNSNAMMTPNDTAVFLWKAFQHPRTKEDVVRKGLEEYDTTEEILRNAIQRFIEDGLTYRILKEEN